MKQKSVSLLLVTGLSGAGKSIAMRALEGFGYYCIDNLPTSFLPTLLEKRKSEKSAWLKKPLAIHIDSRDSDFFSFFRQSIPQLKKKYKNLKILFFTASQSTLTRRFSETRQLHPLAKKGNLQEGIRKEMLQFEEIRRMSDWVLDTSTFNVHQLKSNLKKLLESKKQANKIPLHLISFGFSYGVPPHSDLLFDLRFLPNPYYDSRLKLRNGTQSSVQKFVMSKTASKQLFQKLKELFLFLLPQYQQEGRSYLTIAFGCSGGKHRSVTFTECFKKFFEEKDYKVTVEHRDLQL